jgi:hypothetical protein
MQSYCASEADYFIDLESAYIVDLNNGQQTFSNICASTYCFLPLNSSDVYQYNESGFEFYNYTTWSSSSGYSYSAGHYSLNYSHATGSSSFSGPGSKLWTMWFNGTFSLVHHYAIVLQFYGFEYAYDAGYPVASSAVAVNAQTLGNGLTLSSVAIT